MHIYIYMYIYTYAYRNIAAVCPRAPSSISAYTVTRTHTSGSAYTYTRTYAVFIDPLKDADSQNR
jgi:hypothetical protein